MSTLAIDSNSSVDGWVERPLPPDAQDSLPGLALNSATSSRTSFAGSAASITSAFDARITRVTGTKSRSMSWGRSGEREDRGSMHDGDLPGAAASRGGRRMF